LREAALECGAFSHRFVILAFQIASVDNGADDIKSGTIIRASLSSA